MTANSGLVPMASPGNQGHFKIVSLVYFAVGGLGLCCQTFPTAEFSCTRMNISTWPFMSTRTPKSPSHPRAVEEELRFPNLLPLHPVPCHSWREGTISPCNTWIFIFGGLWVFVCFRFCGILPACPTLGEPFSAMLYTLDLGINPASKLFPGKREQLLLFIFLLEEQILS